MTDTVEHGIGLDKEDRLGTGSAAGGKDTAKAKSVTGKKTAAQTRKQQALLRALLRRGVQVLFFLTMPGAFVAGFNGVKYLFTQIGTGAPLNMNSFVKTLVVLLLFTIVCGRFFCGYACAFGSLGDFIYWLSGIVQKKLFRRKKQFSLPVSWLSVLQKVKYIVLVGVILLCAAGKSAALSASSPWTVFSLLSALNFKNLTSALGIILFVLVLILMALQERFFCQVLCPMGAVFSLMPILPFGMLRRTPENCIKGCDACRKNCPVHLKLSEDGIRNGECLSCGKCCSICPKGNIRYGEEKLFKNYLLPVLLRAVVLFALGMILGLSRI